MNRIPSVATVPGHAVVDGSLSDAEFRLLTLIHSLSSTTGCDDSNSSLGGKLGFSPTTIRKRVDGLLKSGWLIDVGTGKSRVLKVPHDRMAMSDVPSPDLGREIFDEKNVKVSDTEINHLIAIFIKYRINENVCRNAELMSMFYSNPFNREGGKKLVREYGTATVEDVLRRYADRMDEKFCPKLKSLAELYKKWFQVNRYIDKPIERNITIVE